MVWTGNLVLCAGAHRKIFHGWDVQEKSKKPLFRLGKMSIRHARSIQNKRPPHPRGVSSKGSRAGNSRFPGDLGVTIMEFTRPP